jgi:hypothetical protein
MQLSCRTGFPLPFPQNEALLPWMMHRNSLVTSSKHKYLGGKLSSKVNISTFYMRTNQKATNLAKEIHNFYFLSSLLTLLVELAGRIRIR